MIPSLAWILPFVAMLLAIAILPLACGRWWESHLNKLKISLPLGLVVVAYLLVHFGPAGVARIHHTLIEYTQFIMLLGSLYILSGGILLTGDLEATPGVNLAFLSLGAALASVIGTTGASMLLIRPLLKTNSERRHVSHTVIFFIFLVSNIGGSLTPVGDPPLFLGFLRGVPFTWTLSLWPEWLVAVALLLGVYYLWDTIRHRQETRRDLQRDRTHIRPLRLRGQVNLLLLGGVVAAVAFLPTPLREGTMLLAAGLSLLLTPKGLRKEHKFTYGPIIEVVVLFLGIFLTMIPALWLLEAKGASLGLDRPWKFFWATGGLSSFLDNAPTYLVFFEAAIGIPFGDHYGALIGATGGHHGIPDLILKAISLGAVFMGANTYIGNGPNFMVKAIAEEARVKMPSFFGYMKYSIGILVPLFLVITLLFFRG